MAQGDPVKNIYNYLKENKLTDSDFTTWQNNFNSNPEVRANIHSYLTENELTSNNYDDWEANVIGPIVARPPVYSDTEPVVEPPKYSSAREESIAKFGFDWASPTTDLPTPYAKKEKKQVTPKTNFPSSFSIGPGMVSNTEITPEQLQRNKEQVQLNTYQAEVDRISEANETLAFFNPDQYAKFKVPSTISDGFIQTPPVVDFKNETVTAPVVERLGPEGEVNINQARENFKIDVAALRQKQEASKKLMDLDLGEQWSDEYVNSLDTHHLLVDAITPLADKIEAKYGKANSSITAEQKSIIEKGSTLRDNIDSRSLQLQDTHKKIEILNKGYQARAAEAQTQEDLDLINAEYKETFDELDLQQKLILTDLSRFGAEIDELRQTETNIINQNKLTKDDYSKDEDVRKYNDLYKKYSENLGKIDKYRSHPMFKDYVGATNSLNEIKGAGKNLFRSEIEAENRGKKMQEVADFYVKNTKPNQSTFDNIRTDLAFALKSIVQDEPAVGPISIGVNKLKDAAFNFTGDVVSIVASAADVVGTSLGASDLGADLRYNDYLSTQALKDKRSEVESAIRSDVKGGFSMKLLDVDPVFARSNGLDQGTKLVLDDGKVIGYRDEDGFTKSYLLPPGMQQNVNSYAKQNENKAENDYSFARGITETLPSALDFVQLMYFGGALTKGVTKLGLSKAAAAPASVFGISTFQMYGDSYSDYIAKGLDPNDAAKYALGKSAAVSIVETLASPMEARMVAGGASDVVLANFRRVRDTTADLIATGRLGTKDAFSALGSAAASFYKDLGLENVTELIQSDIENAVDNNALNEKNRMNFNKAANIVFATTAITAIPGFIGGASAYNKAKADITTTAIWNSTQNIEDFNAFTEELTKLNKLSTEDAAGIRSAVSYVKEELDQYEGATKENAVGATGLILTRRALESKLANTGNQRAKDIISTKIEGLNTQIDEILGGKAKVEIAPEVADILTEEKGKEDVPTKGTIEYKAGAEPEADYKVGDPIVIGGEQRVITDVVLGEDGNIISVSYDSGTSTNTDIVPTPVSPATETVTTTNKPEPNRVNVLGQEVNFYDNYIPETRDDVEDNAVYTFSAPTKEGLPEKLRDKAKKGMEGEVNGQKFERWSASIGGAELKALIPETTTATENIAETGTQTETATQQETPKLDITRNRTGYEGDFLNDAELIGDGSESTVYRKGDKVVKVSEPYNAPETYQPRVDDALLINELVGDGSLQVVGYYESPNGTRNPVYEQNYVEGQAVTEQDAREHLVNNKGFVEVGGKLITEKDGKYYEVTDLTDNFIRNKEGDIVGIDAGIAEITDANTIEQFKATQTNEQGVGTTQAENVENTTTTSTNTAALPLTLTDVTLTNKSGGQTTGTYTYNEEKQTWGKVNPNGKKTPVNSQAQKDQLNALREAQQQTQTNEEENTSQQTSNQESGQQQNNNTTQEGEVDTALGQEGEVVTEQPITEDEVNTLLEEIGKDSKAREEQIYKFFTLPAALGDQTKAREIARVTNVLWENIAKQLGKRSGKTADAWIRSRVAMLGKTSVEDARAKENTRFQENYTTTEAATAVANNLITELDSMIAERSDTKAIKVRGWTMAQAAADVKNLRAVKAELQKNMKDPKWQVDAYHGTPYVFDKFTTDKIGTGEGAQAFGWGLYFTELKNIARSYADKLGNIEANKNIYKVSLHKGKTPDQYTWLEWDKELSQKQIQDLLDNDIDGSIAEALTNYYTENNDISTTKELVDTMYNSNITGKELYRILQENVGEKPSDKAASIALLNAGIDGVKYPAESISRGLTSDNARGFNYVVFDENAVTIEERIQFQQDAAQFRAATIEVVKNQVIIAALDTPNESSFAHEMAHSFEPDLTVEERQTFIDDYNKQFSDNTKDWNTDVSEFFARAWEKYLSNGRKVTSKEVKDPKKRGVIQEVFDKFTEYLQGIYNGVITYNNSKGVTKPIEVSPAAQAVFDNIIGIKSSTETAAERISRLVDEDKIDELRADVGMGPRSSTTEETEIDENDPTVMYSNLSDDDVRTKTTAAQISGKFTKAGLSDVMKKLGRNGFGKTDSKSYQQAVAIANEQGLLSPDLSAEAEVRDGVLTGKGFTAYEVIALQHALAKTLDDINAINKEIDEFGGEQGANQILLDLRESLVDKYELFAIAYNKTGTEAGRALVYRKLADVFAFNGVVMKKRLRAEFPNIDKKFMDSMDSIVDMIEAKTKELIGLQEKVEEEKAKLIKEKAQEGVRTIKKDNSKPKKDPVVEFKRFFSTPTAQNTVKFQGPGGRDAAPTQDGYTEEQKFEVIKEFARHLVRVEGINSLEQLTKRIQEEYNNVKTENAPDLTNADVFKALALSSKSEMRAKRTEYQKNISNIRTAAARFNKLAGIIEGDIVPKDKAKPKQADLVKLDKLITDLQKVFWSDELGFNNNEQNGITHDFEIIKEALNTINFTENQEQLDEQVDKIRKTIGRINAQLKYERLEENLRKLEQNGIPDTKLSSINGILDSRSYILKEKIGELRTELKARRFEAIAWERLSEKKTLFGITLGDRILGIRKPVLLHNLKSIAANWYEYPRRYVLAGDIGTLMLQGGFPTMALVGRTPIQVLTKKGREKLAYDYKGLKDFWTKDSFGIMFKEGTWTKDSGREKPSLRAYHEMMSTDNAVFAKQLGLIINKPFAAQTAKNENEFFANKGLSDLKADSAPIKKIIAAVDWFERISEGGYTVGLNGLRLNMFNSFRMMNPEATPDELRQYAEFVNTQVGAAGGSGGIGSAIFLAPRLYWSRIKLLLTAPKAVYDLSKPEKRLVAKEKLKAIASFGISQLMIMSIMGLLGFDYEEDPRDKDFLKFKKGTVTADFTAGIGKWAALLASIPNYLDLGWNNGELGDWWAGDHFDTMKLIRGDMTGIDLKASKKVDVLDEFSQMYDKPLDVLVNRASSSLHPTIRNAYSLIESEDFLGKPLGTTWGKRVYNGIMMQFAPLSTQDLLIAKNTVVKVEKPFTQDVIDGTEKVITQNLPQFIGINVRDSEDNMKHLYVEDHLNKIGYNPKTTFTSKEIKKLIPELAAPGQIDIERNGIIKMLRTEVYNAVGEKILQDIIKNNGNSKLSEDNIKDIFKKEGQRFAEEYKKYYKETFEDFKKENDAVADQSKSKTDSKKR